MEKIKDINDKVLRDIKTLYKSDEEDYYKPIRTGNAFSSNYIEYGNYRYKDKTLSIEEYLDKIIPYLSDIINNHKTQEELKIHLTMAINFISSKDSDETEIMHSQSDNIEIMIDSETDETIKELFKSFLRRY